MDAYGTSYTCIHVTSCIAGHGAFAGGARGGPAGRGAAPAAPGARRVVQDPEQVDLAEVAQQVCLHGGGTPHSSSTAPSSTCGAAADALPAVGYVSVLIIDSHSLTFVRRLQPVQLRIKETV